VKIEFSGVCHTDLHAWKGCNSLSSQSQVEIIDTVLGDWPVTPKDSCVGKFRRPWLPLASNAHHHIILGGHEGAGYVAALGSQVHDLTSGMRLEYR